jgi:hypothetical protein
MHPTLRKSYDNGAANTVHIAVVMDVRAFISTSPTFSRTIAVAYPEQAEDRAIAGNPAALIPDWAAAITAIGSIAAIGGFVAAWFLPGVAPVFVMTCGLVGCAIGMRAAERALGECDEPNEGHARLV